VPTLNKTTKTARKPDELTAAEDTRLRLAALVESSDDAIITKTLEGIITSWNNAAETMYGYTAGEAIGKPVTILIPADRLNEEPAIIERLKKGEKIDHYETVRQRKNGTLIDISLTVSPIKNANGKIIGASKIARDITDRKRTERELKEARDQLASANAELERRVVERTASLERVIAQLEEFSYSVSHDLRAPVRAMKGYAQVVLDKYGEQLPSDGREMMNRIVRAGGRMEKLVHDVLTYSRIARSDLKLECVAIDKLVSDIIQQYPEMQQAEISIRPPFYPVLAHEPSLVQAISNLLANGVKFVAPGTTPKLLVWSEKSSAHIRLWIKDNGIGIKPEYQKRLFRIFERFHQNKSYDGTGIGLAIVRKAVEKMGGQVGVTSDGITGSSFWIDLIAARSASASARVQVKSPLRTRSFQLAISPKTSAQYLNATRSHPQASARLKRRPNCLRRISSKDVLSGAAEFHHDPGAFPHSGARHLGGRSECFGSRRDSPLDERNDFRRHLQRP